LTEPFLSLSITINFPAFFLIERNQSLSMEAETYQFILF
jgi:hypothetical protein